MKKRLMMRILSAILCMALCVSLIVLPALTAGAQPAEEAVEYFEPAQYDEPAELSATGASLTDPLTVPRIVVETEDGNGCELQKSDGYVNASITITDVNGSVLSDSIIIKVRGNTTALSWIEKKSFTFKFEKKKDVLGMGKGKKWAIVSNVFDPTLLRNFLAFDTAMELGLDYTSNHKYVELWMDGSFRGNYVLFEPVQEGKDRVNIDIESNNGMKDFLVEYETEVAMVDPDDTYFTTAGHRFIASDPDEPTAEQVSYMQDVLGEIITTLKNGTEEEIAQKIDVQSFAKYYLLNEYFKTYDFSVTSVYFYYKNGLLYAGPPWDYDLSMGNENNEYAGRCTEANSSQGVFANKNLFVYLADKSWFKELVKAVYEEHYDYFCGIHTDGGKLDTLRLTYSETIDRNYSDAGWRASKWWLNIQRQPDKTYEANYSFLKNWLSERNEWFEEYLEPFYREYYVGDTDGNGEVEILDATYIQRILADFDYDPYYAVRGRVTGDDELSILDATHIQRYLASFENIYNVGRTEKARFR